MNDCEQHKDISPKSYYISTQVVIPDPRYVGSYFITTLHEGAWMKERMEGKGIGVWPAAFEVTYLTNFIKKM